MPIEHVYISRVNDGLILVASMEQTSTGSGDLEIYKSQVSSLVDGYVDVAFIYRRCTELISGLHLIVSVSVW